MTASGDSQDRRFLISTGGTILRAARTCHEHGAKRIFAAATHGVFVAKANDVIADDRLERVVITNTGPTFRIDPELVKKKVAVLDAAPLFASTINCIRRARSVGEPAEGKKLDLEEVHLD